MIHTLASMIGTPDNECCPDGKHWFRAVPMPFQGGLLDRIRDAWAVLTEKAYAVRWPKAGELEKALTRVDRAPYEDRFSKLSGGSDG